MAISLVAVGGIIKAGVINAIIKQVNATALNGIVPTSVNGTGVAMTGNGQVTFTNAVAVSVDGVFTGSYDNYRIVWNSPGRTASNTMFLRLRQAGADVTSATYAYNKGYDSGTARTVQQTTAATSAGMDIAAGAGMTSDGYVDIFGPAKTTGTKGAGLCVVWDGSAPYTVTTGFYNSTATAADGFTMLVAGGTWSGVLRVYGYNNLV